MKLKDLFKCVESENKMHDFIYTKSLGYKEIKKIKIDEYALRNEEFKNAKQMVKLINKDFYANIDENIEVVNNNGYIQITFEQEIPDYKDGKFEYKKELMTINLYFETTQEW